MPCYGGSPEVWGLLCFGFCGRGTKRSTVIPRAFMVCQLSRARGSGAGRTFSSAGFVLEPRRHLSGCGCVGAGDEGDDSSVGPRLRDGGQKQLRMVRC